MRRLRPTRPWLAQLAVVFALVAMGACGSTTGPSVLPEDDSYIPNFTFVWDEIDAGGAFVSPAHRFVLLADQSGVRQGTLNDQSNETLDGARNTLTGSWKGHAVTLLIQRAGGTVSVAGTFKTDDTISLVDGARTYTIKRNQNP
jgi:hypothetical protein